MAQGCPAEEAKGQGVPEGQTPREVLPALQKVGGMHKTVGLHRQERGLAVPKEAGL